jgi:transcriptional regulator with XRE-family HTH domain
MRTKFGRLMRDIREQSNINLTLTQMAKVLAISPAYLSSVETGKKSPTTGLVEGVRTNFNILEEDYIKLKDYAKELKINVTIPLLPLKEHQKEVIRSVSENISDLNEDVCNKIINLIKQ